MNIVIDKEFESLIPPLSPEEYQQLEDNCLHDGIRDALIIWPQEDGSSILIDGHNRFRIASNRPMMKSKLKYKKMEFADRDAAKRWIILNQFGRRNLSAYDRSILALKLKPMIAEKAKENQLRTSENRVSQKSDEQRISTKKELAKVAGVSHDTIHKVEAIQNSGNQQVINDVREGRKSINQGFIEIKERERKSVDLSARAHLAKAEERHNDFRESKTVSIEEAAQDRKDSTEIAKAKSQEIYNAIKKILFIGASNPDYSIISRKTMDENGIRRIKGELSTAIDTLVKIRDSIGG